MELTGVSCFVYDRPQLNKFLNRNCAEMIRKYNKSHKIYHIPGECPGAMSSTTLGHLRKIFCTKDLQLELDLLKFQHQGSGERLSYYKSAPKRHLKGIAKSIVDRAVNNNWFLTAFASLPRASASSVDVALSQLQSIGSSLPTAAENMKLLKVLERAQRADLCSSLIVIYHWFASAGPGIAEHLVGLHVRDGVEYLRGHYPKVAGLVDLVVRYVRQHFQREDAGEKRKRKRRNPTAKNGTLCFHT